MDGLDLLDTVYRWLPVGILLDLLILQFALRWSYRRWRKRHGPEATEPDQRAGPSA